MSDGSVDENAKKTLEQINVYRISIGFEPLDSLEDIEQEVTQLGLGRLVREFNDEMDEFAAKLHKIFNT